MASFNPVIITAFQFALPRGERLVILRLSLALILFQFALPRGERRR